MVSITHRLHVNIHTENKLQIAAKHNLQSSYLNALSSKLFSILCPVLAFYLLLHVTRCPWDDYKLYYYCYYYFFYHCYHLNWLENCKSSAASFSNLLLWFLLFADVWMLFDSASWSLIPGSTFPLTESKARLPKLPAPSKVWESLETGHR